MLALAIGVALIIAFFDWNQLREPIARRVSAFTGRSFAINGDLQVHLSLRPRIVAAIRNARRWTPVGGIQ